MISMVYVLTENRGYDGGSIIIGLYSTKDKAERVKEILTTDSNCVRTEQFHDYGVLEIEEYCLDTVSPAMKTILSEFIDDAKVTINELESLL